MIKEQEKVIKNLSQVIKVFKDSEGAIRPHCWLVGPSGTGKSRIAEYLANSENIAVHEIVGAQLTKEGTSGNSLSKALSFLAIEPNELKIVLVDEFDKLFLSSDQDSSFANEVTLGVQNEFLRVLEAETTAVYGKYANYVQLPVKNCLFIFAGAFNNTRNIDHEKLRNFGVKTELLGRVPLIYELENISLESLLKVLDESQLLKNYEKLNPGVDHKKVVATISEVIKKEHNKGTINLRVIDQYVHQYFIEGADFAKDIISQTDNKSFV